MSRTSHDHPSNSSYLLFTFSFLLSHTQVGVPAAPNHASRYLAGVMLDPKKPSIPFEWGEDEWAAYVVVVYKKCN